MKKTFLVLALGIGLFFIGNLTSNMAVSAEADPSCDCRYPQTNEYGVLVDAPANDPLHIKTCKKTSCWVVLPKDEGGSGTEEGGV